MSKPTTKEKELVVNRVFEHILAVNDMSKLLKPPDKDPLIMSGLRPPE